MAYVPGVPVIFSSGNLTVSTVGPAPTDENTLATITAPGVYHLEIDTSNMASGWSCSGLWQPSTAYASGTYVQNGSNAYYCTTAGTSASSGGPTGSGAGITDGSVTWNGVGTAQDAIEVRVYNQVNGSSSLVLRDFFTVAGAQLMVDIGSPRLAAPVGCKFSLTQVLGTARSFQWAVYQE